MERGPFQGIYIIDLWDRLDETKYIGSWKKGLRHGKGTEFLRNGTVYQKGNWEEDIFKNQN